MIKYIKILMLALLVFACKEKKTEAKAINSPEEETAGFNWEGANIYFLLTDRFNNGDESNDVNFDRTLETGKLRGFEGGDLKGITQKINEGYFNELGVNAIWMTPIVEQIHGGTDEGTGVTYGFHGYWTKDWTAIDPNYGTAEDLKEMVEAAHSNGIRVLLDAVINHTGPVTEKDPVWPEEWVRTGPQCKYNSYDSTIKCTLVKNLPDILTDSDEEVNLPPQLIEKWKAEERYEQEVQELNEFFERTGHPRAPRFYIMKWLSDYITDYGIDGYRVDTVKHTEEYVWQEFKDVCEESFERWKENNLEKVMDNTPFYLVGEVYGYGISGGKFYDFGDKKVNYFDDAFKALINFDFKWNSKEWDYEKLFNSYSEKLEGELDGYGTLNYLSSHDDGQPFDPKREKPMETANKLLLSPGASQIYYGDESARSLVIEGTEGDATLRSFMNWEEIEEKKEILEHWRKLGQFRNEHAAIGAGVHQMISKSPYTFYRSLTKNGHNDQVVIGLEMKEGKKTLEVRTVFKDGELLRDAYSGAEAEVRDGKVEIDSPFSIVLVERKK